MSTTLKLSAQTSKLNIQLSSSPRTDNVTNLELFDPYSPKFRSSKRTPIPAWLSIESTIEEINVIGQFFTISGCLTAFWQDNEFDKKEKLQQLLSEITKDENNQDIHRQQLYKYLSTSYSSISRSSIPKSKSHGESKSDEEKKYDQDNHNPDLIDLTDFMHEFVQRYPLPFVPSSTDDKLVIFKNALEFKFTGYKPITLDYNMKEKVFCLQIQFKAKLYECFENNNNEFPFEWQFLNIHVSYRKDLYNFESKIPDFVQQAFCNNEYKKSWDHAAIVRKLDNVDEWKLLRPWVDLRREDDYGYKFEFGLIKYRVRRNPHYYMLEVMIPLFLMVMCAFCVLLPAWNDTSISERLGYIVTLLLAVAAFQISIVEGMPYKSQFTLIDGYFLLAYMVLAALVIEQSIEMRVDEDDDWKLTVGVGLVIFAIWIFHSLRFVFKWMTHTNISCEYIYPLLDVFGIIYCLRELFVCCTVKLRCLGSCHRFKRKGRIAKWMQMEKNEASTWDTTNQLDDLSRTKKAELVLGTRHDEPIYVDTTGEYDEIYKDYRKQLAEILGDDNKKCCKCCDILEYVYSCTNKKNGSDKRRLKIHSQRDVSIALTTDVKNGYKSLDDHH